MGGVLVALGLLGAFVAFALSREARGGAQGASAVPSDMAQRLQTFLESNPPPEQIDAVAGELERAGMRDTASQLRAIAEQRRAASTTATPAPPATSPPSALPPPPIVPPAAAPAASTSTPSATPEPAPSPPPPVERPIAAPPRAESERPASADSSLEAELERAGPTARASFTAALQSASASDLRTIAREVRRQGYARIADALEVRAAELDAQRASGGPSPSTPSSSTPAAAPAATAPEASAAPSPTASTAAIDLALARRLAPQVADDVRSRRYSYSRERLVEFQRAAGLVADGQYGGASRGALIYFGVRNAPPALFQPTRTVRYQPPQSAAA